MNLHHSDTSARQAALDIKQSFCVQAPAGSGKTELLTQRILCLLACCDQPEEILAFTFTRKAAMEMRNRLLMYLHEATISTPAQIALLPDHKRLTLQMAQAVLQRDAMLEWKLLSNSKRLHVTTIDSFTSTLTAQLPLGSNFGSRPVISTDMQPVFTEAIHDTLAWLDKPGPAGDALAVLLRHLHNNLPITENLLQNLLKKREQWLPLVAQLRTDPTQARLLLENNLADMLTSTLHTARQQLLHLQTPIMSLLVFATSNLAAQHEHPPSLSIFNSVLPAESADAITLWNKLAEFFMLADYKGFRKQVTSKDGFPAASSTKDRTQKQLIEDMKALFVDTAEKLAEAGLLPLLQLLARLPTASYPQAQWDVINALTTILPLLAAQLEVAMCVAGKIDHTQTSLAALQALGSDVEPTDLALHLDYRIQHILVDEFQDTSSMQFHLLEKLTAGWTANDGRTLFIVGDGMQSCYAFRAANVGLFLRARDLGIGSRFLLPLHLSINFRSESPVVDWVNNVFSVAFPQLDDIDRGGVCYSPSTASSTTIEALAGVRCKLWEAKKDERSDIETRRQLEASEVADLCFRLKEENPAQSIAILVRGRNHLADIVPALRAKNLSWNASEIDPLLSYPAVSDLFTLLRALLNLSDSTAWFALMRAPFVGLSLVDIEILALHTNQNKVSLWSTLQNFEIINKLSSDACSRLQRCVPALHNSRELRQQLPLRTLLENLWIELGGPATLSTNSVMANISTFLDLVASHQSNEDILDIHHFTTQLNRCYGSAAYPNVNLHLMTLHKAKGLEFDVVIMPGLDRPPKSDDNPLLIWKEFLDDHNQARPLLGLLPAKGDNSDALYQYLKFEAGQRTDLETTRLLYIGVTRAIREAWLFGHVVTHKDGDFTCPAHSLLRTILPTLIASQKALNVTIEPLQDRQDPPSTEQVSHLQYQPVLRLPNDWRSPLKKSLFLQRTPLLPADFVQENMRAACIGELVHLGLKTLVQQGPQWLETYTQLPLWERVLRPLCNTPASLESAVATVFDHLRKCTKTTQGNWLFNTRHHDDKCELAICDYSSGKRRDFAVDRTFVDSDGQRWIIDYKSVGPAPGQTLADFLEVQTAFYRPQLENYGRLLSQNGQPVRLALFFTAIPAFHVLE